MAPLHRTTSKGLPTRKLLLSLVLSSAALTTAAHADTFTFAGTTTSNSIGTGTIITDASGIATAGQITFTGGLTQGTYTFSFADNFGSTPYIDLSNKVNSFNLFLQTSLAGVSTDNICRNDLRCEAPQNYYSTVSSSSGQEGFLSGSLTLEEPVSVSTAATPEPSSLILLGTGALGMAGAVRRRFLARA